MSLNTTVDTVPATIVGALETIELKETVAFSIVIGCSLFSILWGLVNTLLVRYSFYFDKKLTSTLGQKS
jgi:hypothetical protein